MAEGGVAGAIPADLYLTLRHPRWGWFEQLGVIVAKDGWVRIEPEGLRVLMAVAGVRG